MVDWSRNPTFSRPQEPNLVFVSFDRTMHTTGAQVDHQRNRLTIALSLPHWHALDERHHVRLP